MQFPNVNEKTTFKNKNVLRKKTLNPNNELKPYNRSYSIISLTNLISQDNIGPRLKFHFELPSSMVL